MDESKLVLVGDWKDTPWYLRILGYPPRRRRVFLMRDRSKYCWEYELGPQPDR